MKKTTRQKNEMPFNQLPVLPPDHNKIETITDNWEEWVLFILKAVEETAKQTTHQIRSINKLFVKLQEKIKVDAVKLYNKELLELLFEQPYCKIEFLVDRLKISRVTASKYHNGLEKFGILQSKKIWNETLYINT